MYTSCFLFAHYLRVRPGSADKVRTITGTIASAVAEQSATTGEISRSVISAAEKVSHITNEIREVAASSQYPKLFTILPERPVSSPRVPMK